MNQECIREYFISPHKSGLARFIPEDGVTLKEFVLLPIDQLLGEAGVKNELSATAETLGRFERKIYERLRELIEDTGIITKSDLNG